MPSKPKNKLKRNLKKSKRKIRIKQLTSKIITGYVCYWSESFSILITFWLLVSRLPQNISQWRIPSWSLAEKTSRICYHHLFINSSSSGQLSYPTDYHLISNQDFYTTNKSTSGTQQPKRRNQWTKGTFTTGRKTAAEWTATITRRHGKGDQIYLTQHRLSFYL